jgi:quercetin dioxygenase-like cupin family protein
VELEFIMNGLYRFLWGILLILGAVVVSSPVVVSQSTPVAAPVCMVGVEIQPLGMGMPRDSEGRALVVARLTIAPDGGFDVHTHPGMLTVFVDSGSLWFTQVDDGHMMLNRADGTTEPIVPDEEVVLNTGDWLAEDEGMVHMARNRSDEPTIVILSGLVDPTLPLVQCGS